MTELRVVAPATLEAALSLLEDDDAIAVAGGTSIGILVRNGMLGARTLVDLRRLPLSGIERSADGAIVIGGTTTLRDIARSAVIAGAAEALARAAGVVGNPRVRALATLGGATAHGDPRQDVPPVLLALGATVRLASVRGQREVSLDRFYTGFMQSECRDDELVTHVRIDPERRFSAYARFNPASADDYPVVAAAAALSFDHAGRISSAGVALAGAGPTVRIVDGAARLLVGEVPGEDLWRAAGEAARDVSDPTADQRGSAGYKRQMVAVVTARALRRASSGHTPADARSG